MVRSKLIDLRTGVAGQLLRFGLSGGISTGLYFVAAFVLIRFGGLTAALSSAIAYALGTVASYLLQSRFTFRIRRDSGWSVGSFLAVSAFGFVLAFSIVWVMEKWGVSHYAAITLVCLIIPSINFLLLRWQVFRERDDGQARAPCCD